MYPSFRKLGWAQALLFLATLITHAGAVCAQEVAPLKPPMPSDVGRNAVWNEVVLPGPELEVALPEGSRSPLSLRIVNVYPHGTAHRYDFAFYGLEAGKFDLRNYLKRKDGTSTAELPPLPVEFQTKLPPGQVQPHLLTHQAVPAVGGYRRTLIIGSVLWLVGLMVLLVFRHRGSPRSAPRRTVSRPVTLADRLRPVVEEALAGRIDARQLADLERMLLAYWRQRLHLEEATADEAMAVMCNHEEAGVLVRVLESWLHDPERKVTVPLQELLAPYQHLPANSLPVQA